jgi:F-type H+-transporting ATPase subunit epsilon
MATLPTKIKLKILTPDHHTEYEVDEVSLPGVEGDFGVLPGHTPFFTAIRTGSMWFRQGQEKHHFAVSMGLVEVLPDAVSLLAHVAEDAAHLDEARADAGMKRAEEMMQVVPHEIDFEKARLALLRTLQQMGAESRKRV